MRTLHYTPPSSCFGLQQNAAVAGSLHGRFQLVQAMANYWSSGGETWKNCGTKQKTVKKCSAKSCQILASVCRQVVIFNINYSTAHKLGKIYVSVATDWSTGLKDWNLWNRLLKLQSKYQQPLANPSDLWLPRGRQLISRFQWLGPKLHIHPQIQQQSLVAGPLGNSFLQCHKQQGTLSDAGKIKEKK